MISFQPRSTTAVKCLLISILGLASISSTTTIATFAAEEPNAASTKASADRSSETSEKKKPEGKPEGTKADGSKADGSKADSKATDKPVLSAESVVKTVEAGADSDLNYKVTAAVDGNNIAIQTWVNPKSNSSNREEFEKDHKIDAVMITKRLMDAFPKAPISECKIRYYDRNERTKYMEILVVPGVVSAFAQGILQGDGLLKALPLTKVDTNPTQTVASASVPPATPVTAAVVPISGRTLKQVLPGYRYEDRGRVLKNIQKLESMGVGVGSFRETLATVEELVRDGDNPKADAKLAALQTDVAKLEEAALKAKAARTQFTKKVATAAANLGVTPSALTSGLPAGTRDPDNDRHYQQMRNSYGQFWPHFGPLWPDRSRIARRIQEYRTLAADLPRITKIKQQVQSKSIDSVSVEDLRLAKIEPFIRNIDNLVAQFNRMEALVANGNSGVDVAVKQLNANLGLPEMAHDDRYKIAEEENNTWLKGGYK